MSSSVTDPLGTTGQLCTWVHNLELEDVPAPIIARVKHILLDGIGCAFVGASLPWSLTAAEATYALEPPGPCTIVGRSEGEGLGAAAAACLNSTFVQGFELDDYHDTAPLHGASLILPALLATTNLLSSEKPPVIITGQQFLLAAIVGLEIGPRIGLGLGGGNILARGWHSGAVFGGPAVALAVGKMLGLDPRKLEWAVGLASTQAGGLMSAQFGSMAKRMQHGFTSRNGVTAAVLARGGYSGIERVLEREYGGFFAAFNQGSNTPASALTAVTADLGSKWQINDVLIKAYAAMGGTHAAIDCIRALQKEHDNFRLGASFTKNITSVEIELGEEAYKHGGWEMESWPLEPMGAQMSAAYVVAVQLLDGELLPTSYAPDKIARTELYDLMKLTKCVHQKDFDGLKRTRVRVCLEGAAPYVAEAFNPRGVDPRMSNDEVVEKYDHLVAGLVTTERLEHVKEIVLHLEQRKDIEELMAGLRGSIKSTL